MLYEIRIVGDLKIKLVELGDFYTMSMYVQ